MPVPSPSHLPLSPGESVYLQGLKVSHLTVPSEAALAQANAATLPVQFHGMRNFDGPAHMQIPGTAEMPAFEAVHALRGAPETRLALQQALAPAQRLTPVPAATSVLAHAPQRAR